MTSHELAKKLLEGPDLPITISWTGGSRFEVVSIKEERVIKASGTQFLECDSLHYKDNELTKVLVIQ